MKAPFARRRSLPAISLMGCLLSASLAARTPANAGNVWFPTFPGAEGYGARTVGGRGGTVIEVTNLDDSGPGSLRAAIEASGPRIVVFRTGGNIVLQSTLLLTNPYITIAGQTAPGGGIQITNSQFFNRYEDPSGSLDVRTHDVILQYLRIRPGQQSIGTTGNDGDCLQLLGYLNGQQVPVYNVMIDHCSFSWAVDENVSSWYAATDWTLQWCISSEGLRNAGSADGTAHSMGLLIGSEGAGRISLHHNLLAHDKDRNPRIKTTSVVDFVNNVVYNYGEFIGLLSSDYANVPPFNYVGNFVKSGPSSGGAYELAMWEISPNTCTAYVDGSLGPHRTDESQPAIHVVDPTDRQYVATTRFDSLPVITDTAGQTYARVRLDAGATLPSRDPTDLRILNDVLNGTGGLIDTPTQVGGIPVLDPGTPPADLDHDGMPDTWETQYGLNPNNLSDGSLDADGDGYTNIEELLSHTNPLVDPLCGVKLTAYAGNSLEGATLMRGLAGRPVRTDKAYTITSMPTGYDGAILVRYADADGADSSPSFLSFSLATNATVAVAYDNRATTLPSWLTTWTATALTLPIKERGTTEQTVGFTLRTKTYSGGQTITLPGPRSSGGNSISGYIVLIVPAACSPPGPQFLQQPQPQLARKGQTAILSALATGEGPIRYQWRKGAADLPESAKYSGAWTPGLTILNVNYADGGTYLVAASDTWGGTLSSTAVITVATPCDFDSDNDVDQVDFAHLQECLGAPNANASCHNAQLDDDVFVDASDLNIFLTCLSGANVIASAQCRNP